MKRIFSIILFTVILSVSVYAKEKRYDWKDYNGKCNYEYFIYNAWVPYILHLSIPYLFEV